MCDRFRILLRFIRIHVGSIASADSPEKLINSIGLPRESMSGKTPGNTSPIVLVAAIAKDVQVVFMLGLDWRAQPSIKHRMEYQAVRMFGRGLGRIRGGQGKLQVLRRF